MKTKTAQITQRYLSNRSLAAFARGLGVPASRQLVYQWREGVQSPSYQTLFSVLASPHAKDWAHEWATEILALYQSSIKEGCDGTSI